MLQGDLGYSMLYNAPVSDVIGERFATSFALGIGVLSAAGLFAALLGDGWWDSLSWVGLGVPAALDTWGLFKRRG